MHPNVLHNGRIHSSQDALLLPGQVGFLNGWGVFSTIRVCEGVLFAFERHYARLKRDAALMHVPFEHTAERLRAELLVLVEANLAYEATLRVAVVRNTGGLFEAAGQNRPSDLVAFTADLTQWGNAVKLTYIAHGRYGANPFAGTKVTAWAQNLTWYEQAHQDGFDEVVLLNEVGQISECTSANVFVIKQGQVWTPPLQSSGCLPGVTRALLLEEVEVPGLTFAERELTPSEIESADQVFITSTTRDMVGVEEIDGARLHQRPEVLVEIKRAFLALRERYVGSKRQGALSTIG